MSRRLTNFRLENYDATKLMSYLTTSVTIARENCAPSRFCLIDSAPSVIGLMLLLFLGGCSQTQSQPAADRAVVDAHHAASELRVAIVDDSALAASIGRFEGEWNAQTDSKLSVMEISAATVARAENLDADAIIYPPAQMGALAERKLIRPLNRSWLANDPLESADLLQPLESLEFNWDAEQYAVPLGSPVFVLMYRSDLFEFYGKQAPRTWEEYQQLVDFFQSAVKLRKQAASQQSHSNGPELVEPWSAAVEPLADGWASRLLLARAAAYAKHRDYTSVLFDRETMEPLIAGPPFVRALTELAAAVKTSRENAKLLTPEAAVAQFFAGHAAMAIAWPVAAAETQLQSGSNNAKIPIAFAALPGSTTAYNPRRGDWEPRRDNEAINIPLHMISGRVGSVCRGTDSAEAAFRLLAWLASKKWSSDILPASSATTMFRHSQLDDPMPWTGPAIAPIAASEYGQVLAAALRQPEFISVPRIPGESEYMAALDDAVLAAVAGKQSPQKALHDAVVKWKEITGRLGADQQLEAYRRSIKVVP